jgi:hypothetical protein
MAKSGESESMIAIICCKTTDWRKFAIVFGEADVVGMRKDAGFVEIEDVIEFGDEGSFDNFGVEILYVESFVENVEVVVIGFDIERFNF